MKLRGVWLLALLLTACGSTRPASEAEAMCRRQAYDDPAVQNLTVQNLTTNGDNPHQQLTRELALRQAMQSCLQRNGLARGGGVEPIHPRY